MSAALSVATTAGTQPGVPSFSAHDLAAAQLAHDAREAERKALLVVSALKAAGLLLVGLLIFLAHTHTTRVQFARRMAEAVDWRGA